MYFQCFMYLKQMWDKIKRACYHNFCFTVVEKKNSLLRYGYFGFFSFQEQQEISFVLQASSLIMDWKQVPKLSTRRFKASKKGL